MVVLTVKLMCFCLMMQQPMQQYPQNMSSAPILGMPLYDKISFCYTTSLLVSSYVPASHGMLEGDLTMTSGAKDLVYL